MSHREIHACVREVLTGQANDGRFALLDLGCGNTRLLADSLRLLTPRRYLGIDLSRSALEEACQHVASFDYPEMLSTLTHMGFSAGLNEPHALGRFGAHTVMHFRKAPEPVSYGVR